VTVISQDRAWAEIDLQALRHNLAHVRRLSPKSKVTAVIKANGYGHGMEQVSRALGDAEGIGRGPTQDL
jgi:alanine racemase